MHELARADSPKIAPSWVPTILASCKDECTFVENIDHACALDAIDDRLEGGLTMLHEGTLGMKVINISDLTTYLIL